MRPDILDLVCCPACAGHLSLQATATNGHEVITGCLMCVACKQRYPIKRRMPYLYIDDERWAPKAREAEGWIALHKKRGIYDQTGVDIDFRLPYFPQEPWLTVARHFDAGVARAALSNGETVLDLGGGRGWAAKQFALKGCRAVAIDVVADEQIGLGRAWALMEQAGAQFDPIIGDSENLPFHPGTFDVVFCAAVLHHTSNLTGLLRSVYKVLKPGGRLVAVNEPCIPLREDARRVLKRDAAEELALGINESRPNYLDYWTALRDAGFTSIEIFPLEVCAQSDPAIEAWALQLDAIPLPLRAWQLRRLPRILARYARRWRNTWGRMGRLPRPPSKREAIIQAILVHSGGGIVISASR